MYPLKVLTLYSRPCQMWPSIMVMIRKATWWGLCLKRWWQVQWELPESGRPHDSASHGDGRRWRGRRQAIANWEIQSNKDRNTRIRQYFHIKVGSIWIIYLPDKQWSSYKHKWVCINDIHKYTRGGHNRLKDPKYAGYIRFDAWVPQTNQPKLPIEWIDAPIEIPWW